MKIGGTSITSIKIGSTDINKVVKNGVTYWESSSSFIFELTTTNSNQSITIPHLNGYTHNYIIDYGDSSPLGNVTSFNHADCTHVYVTPGTYTVNIEGICETFYVFNGALKLFITKVVSWGNVGFKSFNFSGCSLLTSIPADNQGGFSLMTNFTISFYECSSLTLIPAGLFNYCPLVTTFNATFGHCTSLTSIPVGLFDNNPVVTHFSSTFDMCPGITSIPTGLFDNNPAVTHFSSTFARCPSITSIPTGLFDNNPAVLHFFNVFNQDGITSIPPGLFDNNPLVTSFEDVFSYCPIVSIPAGLFDNNVLVVDMDIAFFLCTELTSIPVGLFDNNPLLNSVGMAFEQCSKLTSIPTGLFANNPLITDFVQTFANCTSLVGNAPTLWLSHPSALGSYCFSNDIALDNYEDIPQGWGGQVAGVITKTVGTTGADYATLKLAFDDINSGLVSGIITLKIIDNTIETASAVLNRSYSGNAIYTSINIYPTVTGKTISGNLATPLIDLNGADNVTIDGRLNAIGTYKDLTIKNTSTANTAGTSTIRFINDASTNTIKYCVVKGSSTATTGGVIFFSTAISGVSGNNNNTINKNDITSDVAGRPVNAICSIGTVAKANTGNIVSDNNIYDFLKHGTASNGIILGTNSLTWTISGNSFYETTSFIPTASVEYSIIKINNNSITGLTVSGNYIGGQSALCDGLPWTKTNAFNNTFYAIYTNMTSGDIENNTIKNFNWSNSGSASWTAIHSFAGARNIGTNAGNTIGSATGIDSIIITSGATGANVYGINILSQLNDTCQNNIIGSITANTNLSTDAINIYGINKTAGGGATTISNNAIGSATTVNSINASSPSSGNIQNVFGISCAGTALNSMSNNIIANLANGTTNTAGSLTGLYINNSIDEPKWADKNFIHSLSATGGSTTATIYGIQISGGIIYCYNNIINLTGNTNSTIYGIYELGALDESHLYFNTVYIAGAPTFGALNSYALYNNEDTNVRDFRDNIFFNARSNNGASGNHYAISLAGPTLTTDYNDYYISGTGGILGYLGGNQVTLVDWQTATSQDVNSLNTNPTFTNAGSTTAIGYQIGVTLPGIADPTSGVLDTSLDYGDNARGEIPSMGAWE